MPSLPRQSAVGATVVGAVIGLAAWLAFVPWDLSEVDKSGRVVAELGDHYAPRIGAALALVTALYCVVALTSDRAPIVWAAGGSSVTWVALFAWRASVARVDGANFWPIGLVLVVIPAAALAFGAVALCSKLRNRPRAASPPPFDR